MDIEQNLSQRLSAIEKELNLSHDAFLIIKDGLQSYKERCLKDLQSSTTAASLNRLYEKIRNDKDLRFPHRKILEFLLGQYDFEKKEWREVNFSRIVREARIGKNKAKSYLTLLETKGYVEKREDGYKKWWRVGR